MRIGWRERSKKKKWTLSVTKVALGDRRNEAILDGEVVGIDTDLNFVQAISNIFVRFNCCQVRITSTMLVVEGVKKDRCKNKLTSSNLCGRWIGKLRTLAKGGVNELII